MVKKRRDKKLEKKIARNRINKLFSMAERSALNNKLNQANRYIEIARKIAMKYQLRIPSFLKRKYCKHCYSYLLPGKNCTVRIHRSKIVIYCDICKKHIRIPLKK